MRITLTSDRFDCYVWFISKQIESIKPNVSSNGQSIVLEVLLEMDSQAQRKALINQKHYTISFSRAQAITLISILHSIPDTGYDVFVRLTFTDIVNKLIKSAPKDLKIFE